MKLAIIGGGAAGTAAAWCARRAGADVTLFFDRPGATSLCSGALDQLPWEQAAADPPLAPDVLAFTAAFEAWTVGTRSARVATYAGILRPTRGADTALLDVEAIAGKRVAVVDAPIDGHDGRALARSLSAGAWATKTGTRFEAVAVSGILEPSEERLPAFDVACLHDSRERAARLAECLRRADARADAWLVGPWLGASAGAAEGVRKLLGKAVGETTSPPGGVAGSRFEASRDALLSSLGVTVRRARVHALSGHASSFRLNVAGAEHEADAVVLAIGGMASGGIALSPAGAADALSPSVRAPVLVGMSGNVLMAASGGGPDWAALGIPALERVGILGDGAAARGAEGVFVAGDALADRPRTVLECVRAGIEAATRAAGRD